jgi:hypothetical protein
MNAKINIDDLFERRIIYPDVGPRERLAALVSGSTTTRRGLPRCWRCSSTRPGLRPGRARIIRRWTACSRPSCAARRSCDVGSGKTELAETIGDAVARQEGIDITLFPLSLSTRGQGRVGEMTQLLSAAFEHTVAEASKLKGHLAKARGGVILLVDEADALAQ